MFPAKPPTNSAIAIASNSAPNENPLEDVTGGVSVCRGVLVPRARGGVARCSRRTRRATSPTRIGSTSAPTAIPRGDATGGGSGCRGGLLRRAPGAERVSRAGRPRQQHAAADADAAGDVLERVLV